MAGPFIKDGKVAGSIVGPDLSGNTYYVIDDGTFTGAPVPGAQELSGTPEDQYNKLLYVAGQLRQPITELPAEAAGLHWYKDRLYAAAPVAYYVTAPPPPAPDGYLAVGSQESTLGYLNVYARAGGELSLLSVTDPVNSVDDVHFNNAGNKLFVVTASGGIGGNVIYEYTISGYTVTGPTALTNQPPPASKNGIACAISANDTYMCVTIVNFSASDNVFVYKLNAGTYEIIGPTNKLVAGTAQTPSFSSDATYLAVPHGSSPFITIYKRSSDTFTKLPNPASLPTGFARTAVFSPDDTYLAVTHNTSPFVTIYKRSGDTFTKLPNPASLPGGSGRAVWHPSGNYLAIVGGVSSSAGHTIYSRSGDTFTKLVSEPNFTTTALPLEAVFNDTGDKLYLGTTGGNVPLDAPVAGSRENLFMYNVVGNDFNYEYFESFAFSPASGGILWQANRLDFWPKSALS